MVLDHTTLLVTNIIIMLLVSASFAAAWAENRQQAALLWMVAAPLLSAIGLVFRASLDPGPAIVLSNGLVGAGSACVWMACRGLGGRRTALWLLGLPVLLWLGLVSIPGFLDNVSLRLVAANLVSVVIFGLSAREVLRLDADSRYRKLWVAGLLLAEAAQNLGWAVFNLVSPAMHGTAFTAIPGFVFIDVTTLVFAMMIAFGLIALIRGQSEQGYRRSALIDALTGLGNRRGFDGALAEAAARARRRASPIGLVMIDVDSFKIYNDLYGHLAGDACLRAVAQALRGGVSGPQEAVFRYGGEEFSLVLPGLDQAQAAVVAERLRLAVRALQLPHAGRDGGVVTISLGVAVIAPGAGPTEATAALAAADRALYQAKRQGRDRVMVDDAGPHAPSAGPQRRDSDTEMRRHEGIA